MRMKPIAIFASILLACAPAAASAQAVQPPHTAEASSALPGITEPELSPSGRHLATKISKDGANYLLIMPIDGSAPALVPASGNDLNWWKWVNDDWLVVGIGSKQPFG